MPKLKTLNKHRIAAFFAAIIMIFSIISTVALAAEYNESILYDDNYDNYEYAMGYSLSDYESESIENAEIDQEEAIDINHVHNDYESECSICVDDEEMDIMNSITGAPSQWFCNILAWGTLTVDSFSTGGLNTNNVWQSTLHTFTINGVPTSNLTISTPQYRQEAVIEISAGEIDPNYVEIRVDNVTIPSYYVNTTTPIPCYLGVFGQLHKHATITISNLQNYVSASTRSIQVVTRKPSDPTQTSMRAIVIDRWHSNPAVPTNPSPVTVSTWADLQTAVNNAPANQQATIQVSRNLPYASGNPTIVIPANKDITIVSNNVVQPPITTSVVRTLSMMGGRHFEVNGRLTLGQNITLSGGSLNGGVWVKAGGTLTMLASSVIENCKQSALGGGAVQLQGNGSSVSTRATFNMLGGTIQNNTAPRGGGVHILSNSLMNMCGGMIKNNQSTTSTGGGVDVDGAGSIVNNQGFYMSGGSITNNTAKTNGGGIYTTNYSSATTVPGTAYQNIFIGDEAVFSGNTATNGASAPPDNKLDNIADTPVSKWSYALNNFDINYTGRLGQTPVVTPSAPTSPYVIYNDSLNPDNAVVLGVDSSMEYKAGSSSAWVTVSGNKLVLDIESSAYNLEIRYKATGSVGYSLSLVLQINAKPTYPQMSINKATGVITAGALTSDMEMRVAYGQTEPIPGHALTSQSLAYILDYVAYDTTIRIDFRYKATVNSPSGLWGGWTLYSTAYPAAPTTPYYDVSSFNVPVVNGVTPDMQWYYPASSNPTGAWSIPSGTAFSCYDQMSANYAVEVAIRYKATSSQPYSQFLRFYLPQLRPAPTITCEVNSAGNYVFTGLTPYVYYHVSGSSAFSTYGYFMPTTTSVIFAPSSFAGLIDTNGYTFFRETGASNSPATPFTAPAAVYIDDSSGSRGDAIIFDDFENELAVQEESDFSEIASDVMLMEVGFDTEPIAEEQFEISIIDGDDAIISGNRSVGGWVVSSRNDDSVPSAPAGD
jgi:predicted outer membrane repeat protein